MDWEGFRRWDGSINLLLAYEKEFGECSPGCRAHLYTIEYIQLIKSRQVAATILATARQLFKNDTP